MFSKIASTALGVVTLSSLFASAAPAQLQKQEVTVVSNCVNKGQVALTFDDGLYEYELDVVKHLGDSKATFFLNGNNFGCIYDHADELNDELAKVEEAFIRILGVRPLYFRPPYGEYNDLLLSALTARGYKKLFLWSDDTQDGNLVPVDQSKGVYDQVSASYPAPHIILGHSVYDSTANDVVPYAVSELKKKGYQLVAVDTCMGSEGEWPYEWVGQPQTGKWQC
ncbi:hypothetical protein QFC21_006100 [Naganishia friedmannii]|uniref:Uncharacterized protein n=1 Tax=Naganishia friedmannii TaxID=89922 RepID=A0ACC2V5L1_9TREE|nr:hypothetical protein QFC21_006100 [Naganishia friedmannii]